MEANKKTDLELELLELIEDNFNKWSTKISNTWKFIGLLVIGFFILLATIFCQSLVQILLVILGIGIFGGILYIKLIKNIWKLQSENNTIRLIDELVSYRIILKDKILVETFKIRIESSETRNKINELETIFNKVETAEYKTLLSEILKKMGISLNDGSREERSKWDSLPTPFT